MKKYLLQVTTHNVFNKFESLNNFKRLLLLNAHVFTFGTRCTPLIICTHLLIQLRDNIKLNLITRQMRKIILWVETVKLFFLVHIKKIFTIENNQTEHYNFKESDKYQVLAGVKT